MAESILWTNAKRKLSELTAWESNPASIGEIQAARLEKSLEDFGQVSTLAIDPEGVLIDGHQRANVWALSKKFGADYEVDVRVSSRKLSEEERQRLAILLRSGAVGQYDWDIIASFDPKLVIDAGLDTDFLKALQHDETALANLLASENPEPEAADVVELIDRAAELQEKWQVKRGDLWQCGKHRILCGDSTNAEDVARLMGGEKAQAVVTDVPYEISQKSNGLRKLDYGEWDKDGATDVAFKAVKLCDDIPTITAFCGDEQLSYFLGMWTDRTKRTVVWSKPNPTVINGEHVFLPACELAAHGRKAGAWFGGKCVRSVWDGSAPSNRNHPNEKPLALFVWLSELTCENGAIVYDPFLGSGTTLVACENTGRIGRGCEIAEKFVSVSLERLSLLGLSCSRV